MRHPFYLAYGVLLVALTGAAEFMGLSFTSYDEVKNVPKSVRDNPGAYRPHYRGYSRYFGGK